MFEKPIEHGATLPCLLAPFEAFTGGGRRRKANKQARCPLAKRLPHAQVSARDPPRPHNLLAINTDTDTDTQDERLHARRSWILGWSGPHPHERRPRGRKCAATRSHPTVEREPCQRRRGSSIVSTPSSRPGGRRGGDSSMRESHWQQQQRGVGRRQCQFQCAFFILLFPTPLRGEQPPRRLGRTPSSVLDRVGDRHSHAWHRSRRRRRRRGLIDFKRRRGFAGPNDWWRHETASVRPVVHGDCRVGRGGPRVRHPHRPPPRPPAARSRRRPPQRQRLHLRRGKEDVCQARARKEQENVRRRVRGSPASLIVSRKSAVSLSPISFDRQAPKPFCQSSSEQPCVLWVSHLFHNVNVASDALTY